MEPDTREKSRSQQRSLVQRQLERIRAVPHRAEELEHKVIIDKENRMSAGESALQAFNGHIMNAADIHEFRNERTRGR